ncbi:uncharacterized protein Ecym_8141 [Eremothecium cymbalariae DBVPG|uniref:SPX domain-containing protein n=1 Tax=Eremothecium cymbalariae (strain CBS 270.75 / DBVPG 7215 / KCTC 17166 / NRRL Y-17582) TaxID=931890 RepID=G8JX58_ERECY|nr:Hypothetical protein Ecym_8141 [Eremothecium cymbalariae DBVPG\
MKFSRSLKYNAVPDWQDYYLKYSQLKRLIYSLQSEELKLDAREGEVLGQKEGTVGQKGSKLKSFFWRGGSGDKNELESGFELEDFEEDTREFSGDKVKKTSKFLFDVENRRSSVSSGNTLFNPQEIFLSKLNDEKLKIDAFYKKLEAQLYKQIETLIKDLENAGSGRCRRISDQEEAAEGLLPVSEVEIESVAPSKPSRRLSQNEAHELSDEEEEEEEGYYENSATQHTVLLDHSEFNIKSQQRSILKKKIVDLYVELSQVKSFIELNRIGFLKITKKFDKTFTANIRSQLIESGEFFNDTYVFQTDTLKTLDGQINDLVEFYTVITESKDVEECRNKLRSHLRDYIVWERNTVWKDILGLESTINNIVAVGKQNGEISNADNILHIDYYSYQLSKPIRFRGLVISKLTIPKLFFGIRALKIYLIALLTIILLCVHTFDDKAQQRCMALVECVALLWATEALPLFVTAMLVPLFVVLFQVLKDEHGTILSATAASSRILSQMWSSTIMVLLAGFTLAAALSKYNIARIFASYLLTAAGTKPRNVLLVVMCVVFFLSMWISNVAAPMLTYSLIHTVLRTLNSDTPFAKALVLGVALAANIGGMSSPISSPQNVISMDYLKPYNVGWGQFFAVSMPTCLVSLILVWLLLILTFKINTTKLKAYKPIKDTFTLKQCFIIIVTLATIFLWCVLSRIETTFGSAGLIAVIPIILFFGTSLLTAQDINNFPWSIVILAMGGIALGSAVSSSGLLATIARALQQRVMHYSLYSVLVIFGLVMLIVGTFVSHTVSAIIIIPLVKEIGENLSNPKAAPILVFGCALIASCGMGLASSGFPNVTAISITDEVGNRYLNVNTFITRGVPASILAYLSVITLGFAIMNSVIPNPT